MPQLWQLDSRVIVVLSWIALEYDLQEYVACWNCGWKRKALNIMLTLQPAYGFSIHIKCYLANSRSATTGCLVEFFGNCCFNYGYKSVAPTFLFLVLQWTTLISGDVIPIPSNYYNLFLWMVSPGFFLAFLDQWQHFLIGWHSFRKFGKYFYPSYCQLIDLQWISMVLVLVIYIEQLYNLIVLNWRLLVIKFTIPMFETKCFDQLDWVDHSGYLQFSSQNDTTTTIAIY